MRLRQLLQRITILHRAAGRTDLDRASLNQLLGDRAQHDAGLATLEPDHRLRNTTREAGVESDLGSSRTSSTDTDHGHSPAAKGRRLGIGPAALSWDTFYGPRPGTRGIDLPQEHAARGAHIYDEFMASLDAMKPSPAAVRPLVALLARVRPAHDDGFA